MRDLSNHISPVQTLRPLAVVNGTDDGLTADLANFDGATVVIDVGLWTDGVHTFTVQDSPDNSVWTAVADAFLDGAEPVVDGATDDEQIYEIGYLGGRRYLRVSVVTTGATTGAVFAATVVRGYQRKS